MKSWAHRVHRVLGKRESKMPEQTGTQSNTTSSSNKSQTPTLDAPGSLGAAASNSGITIDKPSTVETSATKVVDRSTHIETPSSTLGGSSAGSSAASGSAATSESSGGESQHQGKARAVVESAREVAAHAVDSAGALLHEAGDKASSSYNYLARRAEEIGERAGAAVGTAMDETRRASSSVGRFASAHALPLLMIGAGIGWLGMSMRKQRRSFPTEDFTTRPYRTNDQYRTADEYRTDDEYELEQRSLYAPTPKPVYREGTKLMGVRMRDTGSSEGL